MSLASFAAPRAPTGAAMAVTEPGLAGAGRYPRRASSGREAMRPNPDLVRQAAHALGASPNRDAILARWGLTYNEVKDLNIGLYAGALTLPFYGIEENLQGVKLRFIAPGHGDAWRFAWLNPGRAPGIYLTPGAIDGPVVVLLEGPLKAVAAWAFIRRPCAALASGAAVGIPTEARELFRGRHVLYVGDADDEGLQVPGLLQRQLQKIAASLRAIAFPPKELVVPGKIEDINDLLAEVRRAEPDGGVEKIEHAGDGILNALADAPDLLAGTNGKTVAERTSRDGRGRTRRLAVQVSEHLTDLGNARRLVALHGLDLRYCHPWGAWLFWDGRRWRRDATGEVARQAKDTVRMMYQAAAAERDQTARELLGLHALRSEAEARIRAMISLAESEPGIPVEPGDLDRDPWLFNAMNGTLDLRTGELRPHRREDFITQIAAVQYDPEARAPTWDAFVHRIMAGNQDVIRYLEKVTGYALTGDVREQLLFFLYGTGANGKSTFVGAVQKALGNYAGQAAPELLTMKYGSDHPTGLADLFGKRFVATVEVEDGRRLAEALVKQLTGGEPVKARRMREDYSQFSATHKLFLVANHRPLIRGTDHAIWRRIRLIPFTVTIPDEEQDKGLPGKLEAELPGILRWAVDGCLAWQKEGLRAPAEVLAATEEYRAESDVIGDFLDERCVLDPARWTSSKDLRAAYVAWAEKAGEKPISATMFGRRLAERGLTDRKGPAGDRGWQGIALWTG